MYIHRVSEEGEGERRDIYMYYINKIELLVIPTTLYIVCGRLGALMNSIMRDQSVNRYTNGH